MPAIILVGCFWEKIATPEYPGFIEKQYVPFKQELFKAILKKDRSKSFF